MQYIKEFNYNSLTKLVPLLSQIIHLPKLVEHVIVNHIDEIPQCDINVFCDVDDVTISQSLVYFLVNNIIETYNSDGNVIKTNAYKLVSNWITKPNVIEQHWHILYNFVLKMFRAFRNTCRTEENDDWITIFTNKQLRPLLQYKPTELFDMVLERAYNFKTYEIVNFALYFCDNVHISFDSVFYLDRLPEQTLIVLLPNITNLIELISRRYHKSIHNSLKENDLYVLPSHIITSIFVLNGTYKQLLNKLKNKQRLYISYEDEYGNETGVDEGGLTRDFYSSFSQQIRENFEDVDGYLVPKKNSLSQKEWIIAGTLICRSIFCENISPAIPFHPVLTYLMLFGSKNVYIDELLGELKPFEIDFVEFLGKTLTMSTEEYEAFMDMQGEDPNIPAKKYAMNCMIEKYVHDGVIHFVEGFRRHVFQHDSLKSFLTLPAFQEYLSGITTYNITKPNSMSMKENLDVFYSDKETKQLEQAAQTFKDVMLEVLQDLNVNNVEKLKAFLKFWYGTASIQNFNTKRATIQFLRNDDLYGYACFESSTCFYKLYVYQALVLRCYKNRAQLYIEILNMIDMTLANQNLVEEAGLHMQQS